MEQVKNLLEIRENQLQKIKREKEKSIASLPEGKLRVVGGGNKVQFYIRRTKSDINGSYLSKKDMKTIQNLAQKEYDQKVLVAIEKELKAIDQFNRYYPVPNAEQVWNSMQVEKRKMITPIKATDEQFIRNWESVEYQKKDFDKDFPEYFSDKGERVRSKSEIIIANLLGKNKIPYRYEFPMYLNGYGKIHPDFTVLNVKLRKELYWEHLGMMDDSLYVENAIRKIMKYEQNGIYPGEKLILTFETRQIPVNQKLLQSLIEYYLLQ